MGNVFRVVLGFLILSEVALAGAAEAGSSSAAIADMVEPFIRRDVFTDIKLSPDGNYLAATVPTEDRVALVVLRRDNMQVTARFFMGRDSAVHTFEWVSPEILLISMAEKIGMLAEPMPLGELYSLNARTGASEILVGQRLKPSATASMIQVKKEELVFAKLDDDLAHDDRNVIISVWPFSDDPLTRADRMDVLSGRRTTLTRAPVRRARFMADRNGVVRFAYGAGSDNIGKLFYRKTADDAWELMFDAVRDSGARIPLGFTQDNESIYLRAGMPAGPDAILLMNLNTGLVKDVLRDPVSDPDVVLYDATGSIPIGALYSGEQPRTRFFDEDSAEARLQRMLEAAFEGYSVVITSRTMDGKLALVRIWNGSSPGSFYLFDTQAKTAAHVISRREWFDKSSKPEVRPIKLAARDGIALHGYMTLPPGSQGKDLPLVVYPHGGPFGIYDSMQFDDQAQLMALAGYAVLQVNFRGSGGYGNAFEQSGAGQWGGTMQDDLTDATRWAISQGIADGSRICIAGASYGAYAALMGAAKEPGLYRCAVGYVGVYDLSLRQRALNRDAPSLATFQREWVGEGEMLAANSPVSLAKQIKIPVLLAAGGEDRTAPIEHSYRMEKALKSAGVPVETLYFPNEGHGFYTDEHRREYYTRLLAFLSRHIGGAPAKPAAVTSTK